MALHGSLADLRSQVPAAAHFSAAFEFVSLCREPGSAAHQQLSRLPLGGSAKVELEGGAFGILQAYRTKGREEGRWETHRRFIDVQAVVEGEEFMELADRAALEVAEDLSAVQDAIFYRPFDRGSVLRLDGRAVAVYFPTDAHLGQIAAGAPSVVRKVVVKVPVAG